MVPPLTDQLRARGIHVLKELNGQGVKEIVVAPENTRVDHDGIVGYKHDLYLRIEHDEISIHLPVIGGTALTPLWRGQDLQVAISRLELAFTDSDTCWLQEHSVRQLHACLSRLLGSAA